MFLKNSKAVNFRSYNLLALNYSPKFNVFLGLNGVGKTNALDSIHYLCLGKSYFSSGDRHVLKRGMDFFRNEGWLQKNKKEHHVVAKIVPGKKKELEVNQQKLLRLSDHIGLFPCVMIAPADIQLLIEGSSERRILMDQCISQYDKNYLSDLILYNRLLKQRNAVLKGAKEIGFLDERLLSSYSEQMYEPALRIHERRKKFNVDLTVLFNNYYQQISQGSEECHIEYKSALFDNSLSTLFEQSLEKDKILGRTTSGIHKDDLVFKLDGEVIKPFASQGQLKSFIIAIKLAEYSIIKNLKGFHPILLLDDLFDKLDNQRIASLLNLLNSDEFGQIFISDTDENRIPNILNELKAHSMVYKVDGQQIKSNETEEE